MGEFVQITKYLEAALNQEAEWVGAHDLYALLVDIAVREGSEANIRRYVSLAEETATRQGHRLYQAIASRAWGVLHLIDKESELAQAKLEQALDIFSDLETDWQSGRTYFELFNLAKVNGDQERAKDYLSLSQSAFEKVGAVIEVESVKKAQKAF